MPIDNHIEISEEKPKAGLYIAATPIGNLEDISLRVLRHLKFADIILAEDSRRIMKLLTHYKIFSKKIVSLNEHNLKVKLAKILDLLREDLIIVLVSDAGTPLISDPGYPLLKAAFENNLNISILPGASALSSIVSLACIPGKAVLFLGFAPSSKVKRKNYLLKFANETSKMVFFESPYRIQGFIEDAIDVFSPNRMAIIGRELTKMHEQIAYNNLETLAEKIRNQQIIIKGEFSIVIAGR